METLDVSDERDVLLGFLQHQRDLVVWKVRGLDDGTARMVSTRSGLTIHGIVRHLTDVERSWVRRWFAGQEGLPVEGRTPGWVGGFDARPDDQIEVLVGDYLEELALGDQIVSTHTLDDLGVNVPKNLRWVLHHLIEETARHLGHLDLLCEMADGRRGRQPD